MITAERYPMFDSYEKLTWRKIRYFLFFYCFIVLPRKAIICPVTAHCWRLKTKENAKLSALKMVAVA